MSDSNRTKMGTGAQPTQESQPLAEPATSEVPRVTPDATPAPASEPGPGFSTSYSTQVDPLINATLVGRYLITKKLGEGGMGAVYLATHMLLDKQVALKVLHNEYTRKPDLVERFMQEAKSASRIRHENVIDISDFGSTPEGLVFFAMELLQGHDLHEEIARARLNGQLLPWVRSKRIFLQICAALAAAHGHGIVHRDLKPENIYLVDFLGEPDFVKLLDFGIAKLTEVDDGGRKLTKTGMLFGTPEYMSPEQARGEQVDARVDIYAMGCILFQLITGRVPFEAENFMGVLTLHLTELPPQIPLDVFDSIGAPRELAGVIEKALQKDRNQRWSTIEELANAVRRVSGDALVSGPTNAHTVQHAMVTAPISTTMPAQRGTGATPPPQTGQAMAQRQRTAWTGQVKVPANETEFVDTRAPSKSKLPLILGAILVLGGAGAAFVLMNKAAPSSPPSSPPTVASGSAPGSADPGSAGIVAPTPDAAPVPPPLPPLPDNVTVRIETTPRGAHVFDTRSNSELGKTPFSYDMAGSREQKTYRVSLKGYEDRLVDFVPDQDRVQTIQLEKGIAGGQAKRVVAASTTDAAGSGSAATVKPPDTKPPEKLPVTKPPDDKPPELAKPELPKQPTEAECEDSPGNPLCLKKVDFGSAGAN